MTVFAAFGANAAGEDPHGIAKGISEALSTTIVGLAIAIPSLIAYSYFAKKIEIMAAEMESLIADLLAKCYYHQFRQQAEIAPSREAAAYSRQIPFERRVQRTMVGIPAVDGVPV